jgi:hypothetical protein
VCSGAYVGVEALEFGYFVDKTNTIYSCNVSTMYTLNAETGAIISQTVDYNTVIMQLSIGPTETLLTYSGVYPNTLYGIKASS